METVSRNAEMVKAVADALFEAVFVLEIRHLYVTCSSVDVKSGIGATLSVDIDSKIPGESLLDRIFYFSSFDPVDTIRSNANALFDRIEKDVSDDKKDAYSRIVEKLRKQLL